MSTEIDSRERNAPELVNYGPGYPHAMAAAMARERATKGQNLELVQLPENNEQEELSLGELNPLINPIEFGNGRVVESLKSSTLKLIEKHDGILPKKMGAEVVSSVDPSKPAVLRFITRFEIEKLSEEQMLLIESVTRSAYSGTNIRTRKNQDGKDIPSETFPTSDKNELRSSNSKGWYLGPGTIPTDPQYTGVYVFKDFGEVNNSNFFSDESQKTKYIVEVREGENYQTDVVELITQISSILGRTETIPHGELLYEIYYDLIRRGLKGFDPQSVHGMEEAVEMIKRALIYPVASPQLSSGIDQYSESVLLAGVPGTGKTLVAKQLLSEETGILIIPMTALDLFRELTAEPDKQKLFKRISSVAQSTGRRVILHIDDIENVTEDREKTQSTLLNLMAGVTDNGFHIIASTNEPEKMGTSLLEPERFGIRIYTGLQDEAARARIIDIHATKTGAKSGVELFRSNEEREMIIAEIARRAEGFTPRYLGEIATVAKSYLLERIAKEKGTHIGLTEDDLGGNKFTWQDFAKAFSEVSRRYNKVGVLKRDKEIREFMEHIKEPVGFKADSDVVYDGSWSELGDSIAAIYNQSSE